MPTSAVSAAILPRISPAMARTSSSGSGSDMVAAFRLVEVALQDDRGGRRVDVGLARAARVRDPASGLRITRAPPLRSVWGLGRPGLASRPGGPPGAPGRR